LILPHFSKQEIVHTGATMQIPDNITAPWIKRFFKEYFGIPVRARNWAEGKCYKNVWIMSCRKPENRHKLVYEHTFPSELTRACVLAVYPSAVGNEAFGNTAGNVRSHDIAMGDAQWRKVLQQIIADPISFGGRPVTAA
jgi:hypothetical protein